LFIAGQVGWDPSRSKPTFPRTFAAQFDRALANVVEVLRAAGGTPAHLTRMTLYVTNKREYVAALAQVGAAWRLRMGRHYPAMTLVEVKGLLERAAKVEIEATAVL
jgi:enamine deaminase RidA (YjgF/YER057c/UK114 family)